jgi:hypothetical protein
LVHNSVHFPFLLPGGARDDDVGDGNAIGCIQERKNPADQIEGIWLDGSQNHIGRLKKPE